LWFAKEEIKMRVYIDDALMCKGLRVLFIGPESLESNSAGLFRALRKLVHVIRLVNEEKFFPTVYNDIMLKGLRKVFKKSFVKEYNARILKEAEVLKPNVCLVFKGNMVMPQTLDTFKKKGIYTICFYPDLSLHTHGPFIPKCIPKYDFVFFVYSIHVKKVPEVFGQKNVAFLPHGFDPEVHKPWNPTEKDMEIFGADVTFIGSWSPKKERLLSKVAKFASKKGLVLKIWGNRWHNASDPALKSYIMGMSLEGDLYSLGISCSKIVLGLLSEGIGELPGAKITSRTFNIPGSGGFMLHERTDEVLDFYKENEEISCFSDEDELIEKIDYFLSHDEEREKIRLKGYQKALREHTWEKRAEKIIKTIKDNFML